MRDLGITPLSDTDDNDEALEGLDEIEQIEPAPTSETKDSSKEHLLPEEADPPKRNRAAKTPLKIAFLSSSERQYYPEHPGRSKLAVVHCVHDPDLPPGKVYDLPDNRFNKPVSTKGYGIGGLSAPRFPPICDPADSPAPNTYQKNLDSLERKHCFPPSVWIKYGLVGKQSRRDRMKRSIDMSWYEDERINRKFGGLWDKCHQLKAAFGTSTQQGKFGANPKWSCVGPGHYTVRELKPAKVPIINSFLMGPVELNPTTKLHCAYGPKDFCVECGLTLMQSVDYYRTRFRVRINATPTDFRVKNIAKLPKRRRVLLCRNCYCKALRGESQYWKKRSQVEWLFEKTRHCGYIHEHNGLPEYTEKASCYWAKRLSRKEAVLSKHYPDKCERRLKYQKQKYDA